MMSELEIKEVLMEIVNVLNEIGPLPDTVVIPFLSRMEDVLNHIDALLLGHRAEIDCLKIRVEKLEEQVAVLKRKRHRW
jgi:polyhydroxyalkanoate synthesis regulator phasin